MNETPVADKPEATPVPPLLKAAGPVLLVPAVVLGVLSRSPGWTRADLHLDGVVQAVRVPWLTAIARGFDIAFCPAAALGVTSLLAVVLVVIGQGRTAMITTAVVAAGWGASSIFKAVVARPRPPLDQQIVIVQPGHDSYPSGHVSITLSLAVAACVLAYGTRWLRVVMVVGACCVVIQAWARLYLGVHYPTDVIGAVLVASAGTLTVIALWRVHLARSGDAAGTVAR